MASVIKSILSWRMGSVFILGLSSGLPLLLTGQTLKTWMRDVGGDLTVIGLFALVGLPYTLKFVWAPILDRYALPFLDRRRSWVLLCQVCLLVVVAAMAFVNPIEMPLMMAVLAFLVSFFSATQDIAIDAYRREILADEELGFGASLAVNGYRIGMLLAGAGALTIADYADWKLAYLGMAVCFIPCMLVTIFSPVVDASIKPPLNFQEAVVKPFTEFFQRAGAWEILLFIFLFKIGDQMASDMLGPFYLDVGFTKTQIAAVSKVFGLWAAILGGLLGGAVMIRIGIFRSLWVFGILQAVSTAFFAVLAQTGAHIPTLAGVIAFENISSGMGTAAYVGYMMSLCNKKFTATQYALLSSFMGVPRVFFGSASGYLAENMGWGFYFVFCAVIAIPGLLLLLRVRRWQ